MNNPYSYIDAEIVDVTDETSAIKTFTVKPESGMAFKAGIVIG